MLCKLANQACHDIRVKDRPFIVVVIPKSDIGSENHVEGDTVVTRAITNANPQGFIHSQICC